MRRLVLAALVLAAGLPLLLAGLAGPARQARTSPPEPRGFEPLDMADFQLGQLMEGDGPPLERFAPDAFSDPPIVRLQQEIPAPEAGGAVDFRSYPDPEAIEAFLQQLEADHPDLVERLEIGRSWQDRPIYALRLTDERGAQPIADRPIAYLDGQHHARELISNQVVLYTAWWLVTHYGEHPLATRLLETRAIHVIPSVNVDGNAIALRDDQVQRKTANPECCDDDGDGRFDEDPPEGYGYGSHSLTRYEFEQEWADAHPDNPFVDRWRDHLVGQPQQLGAHTGALGGPVEPIAAVDSDGDGNLDEDGWGGVDANRNYDWHWDEGDKRERSGTFGGPEVYSEPEVRAVRDYLAELDHLAAGISYHSGVDLILYPWGHSREEDLPDAGMYELLTRKGSQLTEVHGFAGSVRTWTARGLYAGFGSTLDHIYGNLGAFSFTPEVYGGSAITGIQRLGATGVYTVGSSTGFNFNPRPEDILASVDRWHRFGSYIAAATPNFELNALEIEGSDLVLTLGNEGVMPAGLDLSLAGAGDEPLILSSAEEHVYHNEQTRWRVPMADLADAGNRLSLEVQLLTSTRPDRVERASWTFDVDRQAGTVTLTQGDLRPYVDLSEHFEGWWAGEAWNDPRYRCPPTGQPCPPQIIATPPAGGLLPSPTPDAHATPEPLGPLILPWLQRGE